MNIGASYIIKGALCLFFGFRKSESSLFDGSPSGNVSETPAQEVCFKISRFREEGGHSTGIEQMECNMGHQGMSMMGGVHVMA